jgi:ABC-type sugar transport system permease subunit
MLPYLWESVSGMFSSLPLILLFSLFAAVLLNKKFKGRGFVRSVFFFPVIITSGALIYVLKTETTAIQSARGASVMLKNGDIQRLLAMMLKNGAVVNAITALFDNVFVIIWKSGVQTLLFLAGLQAIPTSLYECADVEGATGWEKFWKITVPMVSPVLLINVVYTTVDAFTDYNNSLLRYAVTCIFGNIQYTYGTTIAWIYFTITFVVLLALVGLVSRRVFYVND